MQKNENSNMNEKMCKTIHEANVWIHRIEAKHYGLIHSEIFNTTEQKRINSILTKIDTLIQNNQKKALDFGAGTGNLTGKLLRMGYHVTAIDISQKMCEILKHRFKKFINQNRLQVIQSKVEDIKFDKEEFDLITCYSVLHHLPDYLNAIINMGFFLRKGGIIYLDHEQSPYFWNENRTRVSRIYALSNYYLNRFTKILYFRLWKIDNSYYSLDYSMSDYWTTKKRHIDHKKIEQIFIEAGYNHFFRKDFYIKRSRFFNPFFLVYKITQKPDMSLWIAKK